jgi:hypothetical protein
MLHASIKDGLPIRSGSAPRFSASLPRGAASQGWMMPLGGAASQGKPLGKRRGRRRCQWGASAIGNVLLRLADSDLLLCNATVWKSTTKLASSEISSS